MAAGTALAVTTLLPSGHPGMLGSGHPGGHPASARLAAWTVAKQANGELDVTINQLHNPAGLQSRLRADGLPVNVTFSGHSPSASCQPYPASQDVLSAVVHCSGTVGSSVPVLISPSALPAGAGLAIFVGGVSDNASIPPSGQPPGTIGGYGMTEYKTSGGHVGVVVAVSISPVYASRQCTG